MPVNIVGTFSVSNLLEGDYEKNSSSREGNMLTKAADKEAQIKSMYVLIFDQNGVFLERSEVVPGAPGKELDSFQNQNGKFEFYFPSRTSSSAVVLHFIANYDFIYTPTDEVSMLMKTKIINQDEAIYWQRLKLENVNQNTKIRKLSLIRNTAKISVEISPDIDYFTYEGFAICNRAKSGSLAPLNYNAGYDPDPSADRFAKYVDDSNNPVSYSNLVNNQLYYGCRPKGAILDKSAPTSFTMEAEHVFENPYTEEEGTYIIIKGRYRGYVSYYKVALSPGRNITPYHLLRNFHYKIKITNIRNRGFSNLAVAMRSEPSNLVEREEKVSGNPILFISCDKRFYVSGSRDCYFSYKYLYNRDVVFYVESNGKKVKVADGENGVYQNPNPNETIKSITIKNSKIEGRKVCKVELNKNIQIGDKLKLIIVPNPANLEDNLFPIEFVVQEPMGMGVNVSKTKIDGLVWVAIWLNLRGVAYDEDGNPIIDNEFSSTKTENWPAYRQLHDLKKLFPIRFEIETFDNRIVTPFLNSKYDKAKDKIIYTYELSYDAYVNNVQGKDPMCGKVFLFHPVTPKCKAKFTIRCDRYFINEITTDEIDINIV